MQYAKAASITTSKAIGYRNEKTHSTPKTTMPSRMLRNVASVFMYKEYRQFVCAACTIICSQPKAKSSQQKLKASSQKLTAK
jgi:2C-methyl-D-erythritol 2,4-cyclodiphosphate synthase